MGWHGLYRYLPWHDLPSSVGVQFGVLSVSPVNFHLLLGPCIEAKVSLISEVVGVEMKADRTGLRDKSLGLLQLAAEFAGLLPVRQVGLCTTINNLETRKKAFPAERTANPNHKNAFSLICTSLASSICPVRLALGELEHVNRDKSKASFMKSVQLMERVR